MISLWTPSNPPLIHMVGGRPALCPASLYSSTTRSFVPVPEINLARCMPVTTVPGYREDRAAVSQSVSMPSRVAGISRAVVSIARSSELVDGSSHGRRRSGGGKGAGTFADPGGERGGQVGPAGDDDLGGVLLRPGAVDAVPRQPAQDLRQDGLELDPGQGCADAFVHAEAERGVAVRLAVQPHLIRVLEHGRVPVGSGPGQQHAVAGFEALAGQID